MGKPTEEELHQALQEAARMREEDDDPHYVGKALLNLAYRFKYLERVLESVEHYLNSGMGQREHALMLKAVNDARDVERRTTGEDEETQSLL